MSLSQIFPDIPIIFPLTSILLESVKCLSYCVTLTLLRYGSLEDFKIEDIGSIKRVDDNLGQPSLMIYESSKFLTERPEDNGWSRLGDRTMRQVAVGGGGVWGLAKDNTLWFRGGTAARTDSSVGESWTKVQVRDIRIVLQMMLSPYLLTVVSTQDNLRGSQHSVGPGQ